MSTSIHTLAARLAVVEARLPEVEGGYDATLYQLHRASVRTDLRLSKIMAHMNISDVTEEQVNAVLDED